jgi:hypothetical protein
MATNESLKYKLFIVEGVELKLSLSGRGVGRTSQPRIFSIGKTLETQVQQLSLDIKIPTP